MAIENSNSSERMARQIHACLETGDLTKAEEACRQAEKISDPDPELILQTGKVHYFCKRFTEAISLFRKVLKVYPEHSEVRIALWACYHDSGDFEHMLKIASEFECNPLNANELFFAYRSFLAVCDWKRAGNLEQQALELAEQGKLRHDLIQALLLDMCAIPDLSAEQIFRIHCRWGNAEIDGKPALCSGLLQPLHAGERLRIGYLSADLNAHPVGFFMGNILHSHDRECFETFCYAHLGRKDEVTEKLRSLADHFVDITHLNHADAAARIHADGIHILIDLGGHTSDTRLPVLAYRPAPVQMTYLGYPNTTGLPTVDYRITDQHAEYTDGTRYMEKLLYMPQGFLCYGAPPSQPRRPAQPVEHKKRISFASFNNVRKLTTQVIDVWSRILNRVPGSGLILKFKDADNPYIRANLFREFARHGIAEHRIELLPFVKPLNSHFNQYNEVDIALDTFPYNGTTTTCDALYMGVPVVTLAGKAHVQRVSCSILKNIGFEESIAYCVDEYVDKAVRLANNPQGLALLHQILPILFRQSILCQPEAFTRQMEGLYRQAWQEKTTALSAAEINTGQLRLTPTNQPEWIFITGMMRSGSTWCYNVVRELCKHHGLGTMIGFVGESEAVDKVLRVSTADNDRPHIIKFHTPTDLALTMLQNGQAKAVYSQRDLRDVVVSLMDFNEAPFDYVLSQRLDRLIEHHQCWKQAPNIQSIEYRDILEQPQVDIRRISYWLGLDCTEQLIEEIALACSPKATRKRIEEINRTGGNDPAIHVQQVSETRCFDTDTLLHANHITSGKTGRYKDRISPEQIAALNLHLKDWLIEEGYEPQAEEGYVSMKADDRGYKQIDDIQVTQQRGEEMDKGRRTVKIENDILVTVPDDLTLMTPYILEEQQDWFEDEIAFVRKLIKPGMNVIDIGANYGCYALTIAKLAGPDGRLWAFEPCSGTADHLQQSIKANGLDQIQLIRAALSNRQGEACLSTQNNSELNSLSDDNGGTNSETVPLYRLDDCMKEHAWNDIEFLKLDAEGEEVRILEGGQAFFTDLSPLVMFELKHGDQINEGLIQAFQNMGYSPYKLIPGLMLLAPFDTQEEADPFQLNLFCCKAERARKLQEIGLLVLDEPSGIDTVCDSDIWETHLRDYPYASSMLSTCSNSVSQQPLPGWPEYRDALNAYVMAQDTGRDPGERYHLLRAAFIQLVSTLDMHTSLPRLLSLARIASELGKRAVAVNILNELARHFEQNQHFNVDEPFLATSGRAAAIDPQGMLGNWCLAQILAERERLHAFSSYFTGMSSLPILDMIEELDYRDAEMTLRGNLIRQRFGLSNTALAA